MKYSIQNGNFGISFSAINRTGEKTHTQKIETKQNDDLDSINVNNNKLSRPPKCFSFYFLKLQFQFLQAFQHLQILFNCFSPKCELVCLINCSTLYSLDVSILPDKARRLDIQSCTATMQLRYRSSSSRRIR